MNKPEWENMKLYKYNITLDYSDASVGYFNGARIGCSLYSHKKDLVFTPELIEEYVSLGVIEAHDFSGYAIDGANHPPVSIMKNGTQLKITARWGTGIQSDNITIRDGTLTCSVVELP